MEIQNQQEIKTIRKAKKQSTINKLGPTKGILTETRLTEQAKKGNKITKSSRHRVSDNTNKNEKNKAKKG